MFLLCGLLSNLNVSTPKFYFSIVFICFWYSYFFYDRIEAIIGNLLLTLITGSAAIESTLMRALAALQTVNSIDELNHRVDETLRRLFGFTDVKLFYTKLFGGGEPFPKIYQQSQVSAKIKSTKGGDLGMSTIVVAKNCPDEFLQRYLIDAGISVVFVLYHRQDITCVIEAYGQPSIRLKSEVFTRILVYYLDLALLHIIQIHQRVEQKIAAEKEKTASMGSLAASIAHEMRNPLSQIHGSLWLIERQLPYIDTEDSVVIEHISNAQKVIQNGLQVIDMTMDAIREKPVNPYGFKLLSAKVLVESAVKGYAYQDTEQSQKVSVTGGDFELLVEPVMVEYVLYNLIKNALYYVKNLRDAEIIISLIPSVDGVNHIEVCDTGPGIAPEEIPKLFDSFYTSDKQGGTGLGLFYCKRTMISLGGDIHCCSELGRYTAFTLLFPSVSDKLIREEKATWESVPVEPLSLHGKTVLVVEDQNLGRIYVKAILEKIGLHCLEAENGEEALDLLASQDCDLMLIDMQMPVMDGLELVKAVRQRERVTGYRKKLPIIVLSVEKEGMVDAAMQLGVSDYLIKPASAEELMPILQRLLAH